MKRFTTLVLFILIVLSETALCDIWTMYTNGNDIVDMAAYGDYVWCATTGGVVRWDTRDMSYTKYTTLDGLPTNGINAIATGPGGEVWCGTDYGAARFQNGAWEVFTEEDGLYNNYVNDVAVDSKGIAWFSYINGALSRFDGSNWTVLTKSDVLPNTGIKNISIDSNDSVWFGSLGLYKYDGGTVSSQTESIGNPQFRSFVVGPYNNVWMAVSNDICYYNGVNWIVFKEASLPSYKIIHSSFSFSEDGTAWFACDSDVWKYEDGFVEVIELPVTNIHSIAIDTKNNIWLGNRVSDTISDNAGLVKLVNGDWKQYVIDNSLITNYLNEADISPEGSLGLATHYGLYDFRNNISIPLGNEYAFYSDIINCLSYDPAGGVWYGKWNGLYYSHDGEVQFYDISNLRIGQAVTNISAIQTDCVWFSSYQETMHEPYGAGVTKWDGKEYINYRAVDGLAGDWVQAITLDHNKDVWIGAKTRAEGFFIKAANTYEITGGVSRFNGETWTSWYPEDGIAHYDVLCLAAESDGDIWAGTAEGASHFNGETWVSYYAGDCLPDEHINTVAVDHDDVAWFGTNNGAASFDGSVWKQYSVKDGLPDPVINDIVVDHENNVFFFTDHGFSKLHRETIDVKETTASPAGFVINGIAPNPFNPATTISFVLEKAADIELAVYNSGGQKIRSLVSGCATAGSHNVVWDGCDDDGRSQSSGVYFAGLTADGMTASRKMTLVR